MSDYAIHTTRASASAWFSFWSRNAASCISRKLTNILIILLSLRAKFSRVVSCLAIEPTTRAPHARQGAGVSRRHPPLRRVPAHVSWQHRTPRGEDEWSAMQVTFPFLLCALFNAAIRFSKASESGLLRVIDVSENSAVFDWDAGPFKNTMGRLKVMIWP